MLFQNKLARSILIRIYRCYARGVFFLPGPKILINSMPKAGTHFLSTILKNVPRVMLSGIHLETWRLNRKARFPHDNEEFQLNRDELRRCLKRVNAGQVVTAHLPWDNELPNILNEQNAVALQIVRDPRDIVVSAMHYATKLRRHYLHGHLLNNFNSNAERLLALIRGDVPNGDGRNGKLSVALQLQRFSGWLDHPAGITTRFERLVGPRGGGDSETQCAELKRILVAIHRDDSNSAVNQLIDRFSNRKSFTFRKGVIGDWTNHFDDEHKAAFKDLAGEELIKYGYEQDLGW